MPRRTIFRQTFSTIGFLPGYTAVACANCGFCFADDIPEQDAFNAYYRELSKYEYQHREGKESVEDNTRFQRMAAFLLPYLPNRASRVLEIGCSTGRLLSLLQEAGLPNVYGLDPSPVCAEAAKRLYGVNVRAASLDDLALAKEKFDLLILVGVLEHIRDLQGSLATIRQLLTAHGKVYMEVPDATKFANYQDAPFQQFSTEHINFFSDRSLTNLMTAHGFRHVTSVEMVCPHGEGGMMPVVYGIYEVTEERAAPFFDEVTERELRRYVSSSEALDLGVRQAIAHATASGSPVIVWGVGTQAQRLLATGALDQVDIAAFTDSNSNYHGKQLRGKPILPPEQIRGRSEPILILTRAYQHEIKLQIREQLGLQNDVLLLWPEVVG